MTQRAVAILSGGMDSLVAMAMAIDAGLEIVSCAWFDYGQRHRIEQQAAQRIIAHYRALGYPFKQYVITLPRSTFAANVLNNESVQIPLNRSDDEIAAGIAPSFVPGRNMVMLALVAAYAVPVNASILVGGWHFEDSSGYPDCCEEFLALMEQTIQLALGQDKASAGAFTIYRPLIRLNKREIVLEGTKRNVPFALTYSCYRGGEIACGQCDTCQLRIKGFKAAGIPDPIRYSILIDWNQS